MAKIIISEFERTHIISQEVFKDIFIRTVARNKVSLHVPFWPLSASMPDQIQPVSLMGGDVKLWRRYIIGLKSVVKQRWLWSSVRSLTGRTLTVMTASAEAHFRDMTKACPCASLQKKTLVHLCTEVNQGSALPPRLCICVSHIH